MASTTTANLSLVKPTAGTNEPMNVTTQLDANWDTLDTAVGRRTSKVAVTTVASSTTETVVFAHTVKANTAAIGSAFKVVAMGQAGNVVTAVPTLTIRARIGGLAGQIIGAIVVTCPAGAQSGKSWRAEAEAVAVTIGASATWLGGLQLVDELGAVGTLSAVDVQVLAAAVTKDSTADQDFCITVQWSASNAANTVSCYTGYGCKEA